MAKKEADIAKSTYIVKKSTSKASEADQESRLVSPPGYTCNIAFQVPYSDTPLMKIASIASIYHGHTFIYSFSVTAASKDK